MNTAPDILYICGLVKEHQMTPKTRTYIRSHLRQIWKWSPERKEVKDRCKVGRGLYKCEECGNVTSKLDIDHIHGISPSPGSNRDKNNATWDDVITQMFCNVNDLQGLCKSFHLEKK